MLRPNFFNVVGTIQKLFTEQHKTLKDMLHQYSELNTRYHLGLHGTAFLLNVNHCVETYLEQITSMLKGAEVAQNAVSYTLWRTACSSLTSA